jgi:hypothetical protein
MKQNIVKMLKYVIEHMHQILKVGKVIPISKVNVNVMKKIITLIYGFEVKIMIIKINKAGFWGVRYDEYEKT